MKKVDGTTLENDKSIALKNENTKAINNKTAKNVNKKTHTLNVCKYVAWFFVILLLLSAFDFLKAVIVSEKKYEIRYETDENFKNDQNLCRLYIDGDYYEDVDYNLYSSVDENGKTDYRYCYIIERTEEFVKAILIIMMAFVVIRIAKDSEDTPFTHKNANRIRIIGALQFALSIAPGMVGFSMRFFRFTYANAQIKFDWVYMFAVSCVIMILAQVFDVGVKLQEENDLIA